MTYRVPSLRKILSQKPNGLKFVSSFSGAGGSCLGLRMAGFRPLWANEFRPAAREVYQLNFPDAHVCADDIRDITAESILDHIGLEVGELDLFEGSPPCAAFSHVGKLEDSWEREVVYSGGKQRVDDLFWEYGRILKGLQPKVFIGENVAGLVEGVALGYFKLILAMLKKCGYRVEARLLDAKWLGVPQIRKRLFFMGVREDLPINHIWPKPQKRHVTVAEAWTLPLPECEKEDVIFLKDGTALAQAWDWCIEHKERELQKGMLAVFGRNTCAQDRIIQRDRPCPTIVQGCMTHYHDRERRRLSIPEAKRLTSYPDDFMVTGSFSARVERIGRSVPPLMMKSIGNGIAQMLIEH